MSTLMDMYGRVLAVTLIATFSSGWAEVRTPVLEFAITNGTGFNISIPEAGKEMMDFRYYISFNKKFKDLTDELFCKGQVECDSPKSRFHLHKDRKMKEGDVLYFYLIGYNKPTNFQVEQVYEVKKNDDGKLEFHKKSSRVASEKEEGFWYDHIKLDKLKETNP